MEIKMKYVCNEPFWKFKKLDGKESYCKVCKKNVVDFRNYSSTELSEYKTQNPEVTCGIFTSEQAGIDVDTVYGASVYRIVLASLISFFTFSVSESKAQSVQDSVKTEQHPVVKSDSTQQEMPKAAEVKPYNEKEYQAYLSSKSKSNHYKTLLRIGRISVVSRFPFFKKASRRVLSGYW